MMKRLITNERGQALLETAVVLPLILLVSIGIFEFGRAYQMQQVLTNAAREGARLAVTPSATEAMVKARVKAYLESGMVPAPDTASVSVTTPIDINVGTGIPAAKGTRVTVSYPYSFMVLNPVARLVVKDSKVGAPITMSASAEMRNE